MIKRIIRPLIAASTVALLTTVLTSPAQAAGTGYEVCNSSYSLGAIKAFNSTIPVTRYILPGDCYLVSNSQGGLRIDPDPELGDDVDRYRIGERGGGYRDWVSGEATFNPPNAWELAGVRVHTD